MAITLDRQLVTRRCEACAAEFPVVRGSVSDSGRPFGLYLIALHGHGLAGRIAHLAIAILDPDEPHPRPVAAAMDAVATPGQFGFSVVDWERSPWKDEAYLGERLNRAEILAHPKKAVFFHIAEHLVGDLPEVNRYLDGIG